MHDTNENKIHLAYRQFTFARHTHTHIYTGSLLSAWREIGAFHNIPQMEYSIKICGVLQSNVVVVVAFLYMCMCGIRILPPAFSILNLISNSS